MRIKPLKRTISYAIKADYSVALARLIGPETTLQPGLSQFLPVHDNEEALAWRLSLIEKAEKSIDAQYYSWHADISGRLLISKLIDAADRGVRVRILLDDIHTFGADRQIAILNHHKNIEVRLFNPFRLRWPFRLFRIFELLWDLDRLNHRMHNKLLIADNVVSVLGGRNIGDEYFGISKHFEFRDMDILISGDAVLQFSRSFDIYWNNRVSRTARRTIAFRPRKIDFRKMRARLEDFTSSHSATFDSVTRLKSRLQSETDFHQRLIISTPDIYYDPPDRKGTEPGDLAKKLFACATKSGHEIIIISPYFVPTADLFNAINDLLVRGIRVQLFTNSLESIDVTAAFSGYQHYRHRLLALGVELYEFRSNPAPAGTSTGLAAITGEAYRGLHAKSIIYDSSTVYIGSSNLDMRSANLNTELGMLINNTELCTQIRDSFLDDLENGQYWRVRINLQGKVEWSFGHIVTTVQPARSLRQRLANLIYSHLPIKQYL